MKYENTFKDRSYHPLYANSKQLCPRIRYYCSKIEACQSAKQIRKQPNTNIHRDPKSMLLEAGKINFIPDSDTLHWLETYSYETGKFYGKVWNNEREMLEYTFFKEKMHFERTNIFSEYMCKLVTEWNLKEITRIKSDLVSPLLIYASRIVRTNGEYFVDCVMFDEFFSPEKEK